MPLLLWRVGLLFLVYAVLVLLPWQFNAQAYQDHFHWPADEPITLLSTLKTWDGNHYLYLAEVGYEAGSDSTAFYPLWPWLIRAAAVPLGGSHLAAALLLSNLFGLLAVLLFHRLVERKIGTRAAGLSVLLLLVFPGALFLGLPYTESLFLLLAVGLLVGIGEGRRSWAVGAAFLLPLARPIGLFAVFPLAVDRLLTKRKEGSWRPVAADAVVLAPVAGFAAYLLAMQLMTGNALEGFEAQSRFYTESTILRVLDVPGFLGVFFSKVSLHGFETSLLDRAWFVCFLAALPAIWKLDKVWFAYVLPMGLVPAMTVNLLSFTRYFLVLIPVFAVAGLFFSDRRRLPWLLPLAAVLLGLQVLLLVRHVNNFWAG